MREVPGGDAGGDDAGSPLGLPRLGAWVPLPYRKVDFGLPLLTHTRPDCQPSTADDDGCGTWLGAQRETLKTYTAALGTCRCKIAPGCLLASSSPFCGSLSNLLQERREKDKKNGSCPDLCNFGFSRFASLKLHLLAYLPLEMRSHPQSCETFEELGKTWGWSSPHRPPPTLHQ